LVNAYVLTPIESNPHLCTYVSNHLDVVTFDGSRATRWPLSVNGLDPIYNKTLNLYPFSSFSLVSHLWQVVCRDQWDIDVSGGKAELIYLPKRSGFCSCHQGWKGGGCICEVWCIDTYMHGRSWLHHCRRGTTLGGRMCLTLEDSGSTNVSS
jgi:hypothetical protein